MSRPYSSPIHTNLDPETLKKLARRYPRLRKYLPKKK